uniref:Uncharacterized protein n=1 Tax=Plectus sambesii TaxID=2011161 RepID=A0A914WDA2_9BILA
MPIGLSASASALFHRDRASTLDSMSGRLVRSSILVGSSVVEAVAFAASPACWCDTTKAYVGCQAVSSMDASSFIV